MKTPRFVVSLLAIIVLLVMCMLGMWLDHQPAQALEPQSCPVSAYQTLMGKPEKELEALMAKIPPTQRARAVRIVCHHCAVTMDYSPTRLNIMLDEDGKVSTLRCG